MKKINGYIYKITNQINNKSESHKGLNTLRNKTPEEMKAIVMKRKQTRLRNLELKKQNKID